MNSKNKGKVVLCDCPRCEARTLAELKRGVRAELVDCRNCGGDGYTMAEPACPACKGSGKEVGPSGESV